MIGSNRRGSSDPQFKIVLNHIAPAARSGMDVIGTVNISSRERFAGRHSIFRAVSANAPTTCSMSVDFKPRHARSKSFGDINSTSERGNFELRLPQ